VVDVDDNFATIMAVIEEGKASKRRSRSRELSRTAELVRYAVRHEIAEA
jgi:hypothetical protein